ncbi:unnamed protein product [Rotaria sp. Silwood2]|nr:unnamed protein product [Rotaria sp. Silwood2]
MLFTHYLFGYVGTTICSVGLVLALCSVYIFTRRQMRSVVSTYLAGLSISDSCLLLLGLIFAFNFSIPPNRQTESFYSSRLHKYLFPYVYACIIWFQFTSVWVIIGFAIDRWFAIKWPMLHYTHSSKRACYIVVTIYCLGFIYSLPRFFEYKAEIRREELTVVDNYTEYYDHVVVTNKLHNSTIYQYTVHLILYSLLQSILPLLLLSYFNVELIRSVHASSHFLQRCTPHYVQNTRIARETNTIRFRDGVVTRSVICLIGLFTICQVPASILHYIYMFYRNHKWLYICYDISNFLIFFNSTAVHSNYWEYQKRPNNGNIFTQRKPSFEPISPLRSIYRRTSSLHNINLTKTSPIKYGRYSICECNHRKTSLIPTKERKSLNFNYQKSKHKTKDNYYRCNSEQYSLNPKKYSLSMNTNTNNDYNRGQKLHYITYKCKNNHQKLARQSSSTTTTTTITSNVVQSPKNVNASNSTLTD